MSATPDRRALAVDVGGTNVRAALTVLEAGDTAPAVAAQDRLPLDRSSPQALMDTVAECVSRVRPGEGTVEGIGVAMKGFVDPETGTTVGSAYLGMKDIPVRAFLHERFGLPVHVANDVQAATVGELCYGAGRECSELIYLNVGTGIAVGLVLGGRLYRGAANLSGEFGHITVQRDGIPCSCGRRGCLEAVVSGPGIAAQAARLAEEHPESALHQAAASGSLNATAVFSRADDGDAVAKQLMLDCAGYLGDGIANLINVLNPQAVILGGGVFSGAHSFVQAVEKHVRQFAIDEDIACLKEIGMSSLDVDNAGLIGAAALVFEDARLE